MISHADRAHQPPCPTLVLPGYQTSSASSDNMNTYERVLVDWAHCLFVVGSSHSTFSVQSQPQIWSRRVFFDGRGEKTHEGRGSLAVDGGIVHFGCFVDTPT